MIVLVTLAQESGFQSEKKKEAQQEGEKAKPKSEKVKYPVRIRMELKFSEKHLFSNLFFSLSFFLLLPSFFAGLPDKLAKALIFTHDSILITDKYAIFTGKNTDSVNNGTID